MYLHICKDSLKQTYAAGKSIGESRAGSIPVRAIQQRLENCFIKQYEMFSVNADANQLQSDVLAKGKLR